MLGQVVVRDALRVGDEGVGGTHGLALRPAVVPTPRAVPLLPLPLETVDVHGDGDADAAEERHEGRVGGVEDEGHVGPGHGKMHARGGGAAEGLRRLEGQARDVDETHAAPGPASRSRSAVAVDDDLVAALDETGADLLDRGLEPAVGGGGAARPDHRDPHQKAPAGERTSRSVRHMITRSPTSDQFST